MERGGYSSIAEGDGAVDNVIVPLLATSGQPGCCGGLCPGESCERLGNFCFFFTVCTASLVATMATTALSIVDTAGICTLYVWLAPEFKISKPQTGIGYHFNHTMNDIVISSCMRTFFALTSHAISSLDNLYRPYLYVSSVVAMACTLHVSLKAASFDYMFVADRWVAPMLFSATLIAAYAHVAIAYHVSLHALRTLKKHKNVRTDLLSVHFGNANITTLVQNSSIATQESHPTATNNMSKDLENNDIRASVVEGLVFDLNSAETSGSALWEVPVEQLTDTDSRFIEVSGLRLHYKDVGGGTISGGRKDCAVLLIHGFGAGVFAWRHLGPAVADLYGTRIVAFDRPGFGLSDRPKHNTFVGSHNPYSIASQAVIVEELCVALKISHVLLVGHADGCMLAMQAAAVMEKKGRVRCVALALLSANTSSEVVPAPVRLLLNSQLGMSMLRPLLQSEIGEVANRRAWFDRSKLTRQILTLYKRPLSIQGWDNALLEVARTRHDAHSLPNLLAAISTTPVLMIAGANDVIVPPEKAVKVATELQQCHLKLLPNCGHLPHEEQPEALLKALIPFILENLPHQMPSIAVESVVSDFHAEMDGCG